MSIFSKIFRNSIIGGGSLESYNDFWYGAAGGPTKSGVPVNEETALKYLAFFACVSLISGDIARLPLILYQRSADGSKKRVLDHPLYDILRNAPNKNTTSFNWRELSQNNLLTWGNSYSEIKRATYSGEIKELIQIPKSGGVSIKQDRRGIYYEWIKETITANGPVRKKVKKYKKDIFHIPGFGFNGLVGMSIISIAREAIGLGRATEDFGALYFGQGTHPGGVYEMDGYLGDNEKQFKKVLNEGFQGLSKSHKLMILQGGAKYKPLTVPLNDAQFLETRKFQKVEICGMFKVPPHKIAIHDNNSNNSNLEQENSGYVDSCLMPWAIRWEQNISLQLLRPEERKQGLFVEFLMNGLLRGDSQARAEYYRTMFQTASMSPNDINAADNRNPIPGGDQYFVPLNMIPLDQASDFASNKTESKNLRAIEYRKNGSILIRDRITKQYFPLFLRAAQDIINRESIAVKKQVIKQQKNRANESMQRWLDDFYSKFPAYIRAKIGPVMRSYSEAIQAASSEEMEIDVGMTEDLERFIDEFITGYEGRHTQSSLGQLTSELENGLAALLVRVDEWEETRAEKIATNETNRNSSAVYQFMAFSVGLRTVLRNRGPKTCPFCRKLANKSVRAGGAPLVKDGQELEGKNTDQPPMLIRGDKYHTPIHQKCDCYMSIL